jgi:hypothetical protein
MRASCCVVPPLGSPGAHLELPDALLMYAVDSVPRPRSVLAHTKLALGQAQHEEHPGLMYNPVQMPVPPNGVPPHMFVATAEVIKLYSSSEWREARQEAAPGRPDAGRAAQPARAAAYDTALFTPRKQKTELLLAGVRHEETQLVRFGDWPPAKGAAARSSVSMTRRLAAARCRRARAAAAPQWLRVVIQFCQWFLQR